MLQLTDIRKTYGSRIILQIPAFEIPAGSYWIKGINGSGKTSLMKIIAGINPFEGNVVLHKIELTKQPIAYRKQVSYAEAEPLFPGFLSGWDLIRFVQQARNENEEFVNSLVDYFGIRNFLGYPVGTYSSGMSKKLSLLLAFIGPTTLILLDEPLITLDDAFLPLLFSIIHQRQEDGTSFLLSSHQPLPENQFASNGIIMVENSTAKFVD